MYVYVYIYRCMVGMCEGTCTQCTCRYRWNDRETSWTDGTSRLYVQIFFRSSRTGRRCTDNLMHSSHSWKNDDDPATFRGLLIPLNNIARCDGNDAKFLRVTLFCMQSVRATSNKDSGSDECSFVLSFALEFPQSRSALVARFFSAKSPPLRPIEF